MSFYLPSGFKVENAEQLIALYKTLLAQPINTEPELRSFLKNVSDLESAVSEDMAWRYIRMTCDTSNKAHNDAYEEFVTKIQPKIAPFDNEINKKIVESPVAASSMTSPEDAIYLRTLKSAVDIFRDENIELNAKLATLAQEYGSIQGGMSVNLEGKELTMQQAGNYLLKTDRNMRKTAWESITAERLKATNRLEDIMNEMVQLRHQVAINAGFANFRDYMFQAMCRFDYTVQDCLDFHKSVRDNVVPVVKKLTEQRKEQMGIDNLMPWDTSVHPQGLEPLKPFNGEKDLTDNTIKCFADLDSYFGQCIQTMQTEKLLDLESRKGKAPGGYNMLSFVQEQMKQRGVISASKGLYLSLMFLDDTCHALIDLVESYLPGMYHLNQNDGYSFYDVIHYLKHEYQQDWIVLDDAKKFSKNDHMENNKVKVRVFSEMGMTHFE